MNAREKLQTAKEYKSLTGTPIDDDIIEAFESTIDERDALKIRLDAIEKRAKEVIALGDFKNVANYILNGEGEAK